MQAEPETGMIPPITCEGTAELGKVIETLSSQNLYRIHLVDHSNQLLGVVTLRDIIGCFVSEPQGYFDGYFGGSFKEIFGNQEESVAEYYAKWEGIGSMNCSRPVFMPATSGSSKVRMQWTGYGIPPQVALSALDDLRVSAILQFDMKNLCWCLGWWWPSRICTEQVLDNMSL